MKAKAAAAGATPTTKLSKIEAFTVELIEEGDSSDAFITSVEIKDKLVMASGGTNYTPIVLASTDGKTFRRRTVPGAASGVRSMRALDDNPPSFWLVGEFGLIARTTDRGATWTVSKNARQPCLWDLIEEKETGAYWVAGDEGLVLRSKNKGKSWEKVKVPFEPRDSRPDPTIERVGAGIFFTVFACVWDVSTKKFFQPKGLAKAKLCAIATSPIDGTVLAVGDRGAAFRSADGGRSFTKVHTGITAHLEDVAFVGGTFVAVGTDGAILRITADGKKITKLASKTKKHLWSIGSWGTGAIIGGAGKLLMRLATNNDTYWDGTEDELAIRVVPVPGFVPAKKPSPAEIEKRHQALLKSAIAEYEKLPKPKRSRNVLPSAAGDDRFDESIVKNPDDPANFMVYTDLLQSRSDPRGELAALTQEEPVLNRDGSAPKLAKGASAILKRHAATLLGKLKDAPAEEVGIDLAWRHGFIHSAFVRAVLMDPDEKPTQVAAFVGHLLEEPSARYLRDLRVGIVDFWQESHAPIVKLIAPRSFPTLRSLILGEIFGEGDEDGPTAFDWGPLGDPSSICASLPKLETLRIYCGSLKLGRLVLPHLRVLALGVKSRLDRASMKSLLASALPSLEKLTLIFGGDDDDGISTAKALEPLLKDAPECFPRLTSLGIVNFRETNELIVPLAKSKLIAQLRELNLSSGTLADEGAAQLLSYAPAFTHLDAINVRSSYLSKELVSKLEALGGPAIDARLQRSDPGFDERTPSIVE
jgi:photosystem II stability/assembly factor-like uncharacterized protein